MAQRYVRAPDECQSGGQKASPLRSGEIARRGVLVRGMSTSLTRLEGVGEVGGVEDPGMKRRQEKDISLKIGALEIARQCQLLSSEVRTYNTRASQD